MRCLGPRGRCGRCGSDTVWRWGTTHVGERSMSTSLFCDTCGQLTGSLVRPRDTPLPNLTPRREPDKVRDMAHTRNTMSDTVAMWVNLHQNCRIRRRNGEQEYVLRGVKRYGCEWQLKLERPTGSMTWAPIEEIRKFVLCNPTGKVDMERDDAGQCRPEEQTDFGRIADHLSACYNQDTLKAGLAARRERDAALADVQRQREDAKEAKRSRREIAIKALEKAAKAGDVGAANSLLEL